MRLAALYATSIICGFCMMALEIVGGRYVQNFFGSSIDVWAAIISVFILSLSVGYVVGGRVADHERSNAPLGWIIVAASLFYLTMPLYGLHFQAALGESVHTSRWGVLIAAFVLYLPPSLLLGMISPILVKLVFTSAERVGRSTGTLYAVGSIGNVIGILVSDYLLLAWFDLNHIIYGMGAVLALLGLAHLAWPIAIVATKTDKTADAQPAAVAP
jgi:predicted membrane-bound spermidine synthase